MSRTVSRYAVCAFAALIGTSTSFGDEKDEWKALKGAWNVEKAVVKGTDSSEALKAIVLTIDEGKYVAAFAGNEDKGTLKLDPAAKPKRVTITSTEGPNKGKTMEAIYEINGDTLKVCYALEGKDPPKEFESKEGTETLFVIYKRGKEKPKGEKKEKE